MLFLYNNLFSKIFIINQSHLITLLSSIFHFIHVYVNDLNTKNYDNMQVLSAIIMYTITKYSGHLQEVSTRVYAVSRRHLVH